MGEISDFLHNEKVAKLEPKLKTLCERIGRVDHMHHQRLVTINAKFKAGEHLTDKDVDFITRLYDTI